MPGVVLVTGGLGYLGSQLLHSAPGRLAGWTLRVFDNLATRGERALVDLPGGCRYEFVEGDVLDSGTLRYALQGVSSVVHLAGVVRTPMSFEHPTWMRQVNTWGTAALVEACVQTGVERLVYASTTAVYGPGGPFDETASPSPVGPYAASKRAAEQTVLGAGERGLATVVLRLGMLYGHAPCARYDGFVNRLLFQAGTGRALTVYGSGTQRRPIVHVSDAASAVLRALESDLPPGVYNAVESNASVTDVVAAVKAVRPEVRERFAEQDVLNHLSFLVDSERLRSRGWGPVWRLADAVGPELAHFVGLGPASAGPSMGSSQEPLS